MMSSNVLAIVVVVYITGLLTLRRIRVSLVGYLWGSFGFAAIIILAGTMGAWNAPIGELQARILVWLGGMFGLTLQSLGTAELVVPDPTGWSILSIGIECSTLIEASVFAGLLLFYPRFPASDRLLRLLAGVGATFLINLARLAVIVGMVATLGKAAVPLAHTFVGRMVFFIGIVVVYWRMLTMPTLRLVRRDLEISGRAVM